MKENLENGKQFILFLLVGFLNTLFGFCIYAFFIYSGFKYYLAVLFSTSMGIFFSYFTIGRVVFNTSDKKVFKKFFLLYILLFFMNSGLIKMLTLLKLDFYLAGFISIAILSVFSFLMNKHLVFNNINT
jgi:putative flippase GtrA